MSDLDDLFGSGTAAPKAKDHPARTSLPAILPPSRRDLWDAECRAALARSHNLLVPWFLMAQYLYYYRDDPILTDAAFDEVARRLTAEWDGIAHVHKPAAALYVEGGQPQLAPHLYPLRARGAACRLAGIELRLYPGDEGFA